MNIFLIKWMIFNKPFIVIELLQDVSLLFICWESYEIVKKKNIKNNS